MAGALLVPAALHAAPAVVGIPAVRARTPRLAGVGGPRSVALTFDDGPDDRSTPAFLDLLRELDVRATFFVLGSMLERAPDLARRLVDEGHEIGVHGWTHRVHLRLPWWTIHDELARTVALVHTVTGARPRHYRPPYGVLTGADVVAARRLRLRTVLWTAWGRDWRAAATSASVVGDLQTGGLRGGATLLLHDSDCTSAPRSWVSALAAVPAVVETCRQDHLDLVTLREHLG